jgi:hypothetical protein
VDFFLVWSVKEELADFSLVKESLKHTLEGVSMTTAAAMFTTAYRRLFYSCKIVLRSAASV